MRTFNLVKSLTRVINNRKGLLILCLSLAVFGVNEVWGESKNYYAYAEIKIGTGKGKIYQDSEVKVNGGPNTSTAQAIGTNSSTSSSVTVSVNLKAEAATGYSFDAWSGDNTTNAASITVNKSSSNTNSPGVKIGSYTANFKANTNTAYTVKHYQQNIDGSYPAQPFVTENLTGTTDASVTPTVKTGTDIIGFTAPETQTKTIAGDGSLVIEYKYTRNSYTLTWNLDGGTITTAGTPAGSVKYGATLTAPTVSKAGSQFNGWSPSVPSTMPDENVTYTAQWVSKYDFEMSGEDRSMKVDEELPNAFTFTHADNPVAHISNTNVATYDAANNKLIAHQEGTTTIYFTQEATSAIKAGTSDTYTITVSKIDNTLAVDATHSMKVDETWSGVISGKNSDATVTTTTSDETVAYYDVANNKIVAQNTGNQSFNSKEVTITISQEATYKYTAAEKTITVTVNKHDNHISINGTQDSYQTSIYVDAQQSINLTATNTDYSGSPITATQTAGEGIVALNDAHNQVSSNSKLGIATWSLSQPENYKFKAASASFTVNVKQEAEATDCYVLNDANERSWNTNDNSGNYGPFNAAGTTLYFEAKRTAILGITSTNYFYAQYSTDGNNWTDCMTLNMLENKDQWYPLSCSIPETAKYIRFETRRNGLEGGVGGKQIRNVKVTRKTYLNASDLTIEKTNANEVIYPNEQGEGTITINRSLASGGNLKVAWDSDKFTINGKSAAQGLDLGNFDCATGTSTLNVVFSSDVAGTFSTPVRIYNKVYNTTVTFTGITHERETSPFADKEATLDISVNEQDKVTLDLATLTNDYIGNGEITYSVISGEGANLSGTTFYATKVGTYQVKATAAQTNKYNKAEKTITINVVKRTPSITWKAFEHIYAGDILEDVASTLYNGNPVELTKTYASLSDAISLDVDNNAKLHVLSTLTLQTEATVQVTTTETPIYKSITDTHSYTLEPKATPVFYLNDKVLNPDETTDLHLEIGKTANVRFELTDESNFEYPTSASTNYFTYEHNTENHTGVITATKWGDETFAFHQKSSATIFDHLCQIHIYVSKHQSVLTTPLTDGTWKVDSLYTGNVYSSNDAHEVIVSTSDEKVLKVTEDGIKAVGAGSATLYIRQKATDEWTGDSISVNINVEKYTPEITWNMDANHPWGSVIKNPVSTSNTELPYSITSSNPSISNYVNECIEVYNTSGSVTYTFAQEGNYKWNAANSSKTITIFQPANHVPFTLSQGNYGNFVNSYNKECTWDAGLRVASTAAKYAFNWDDRYVILHFEGIPDKLYFSCSNSTASSGTDFYVCEGSSQSSLSQIWSADGAKNDVQLQLQPNTRYVKLCFSGNYAGYFSNVQVTERKEIVAPISYDFGAANVGADASKKSIDVDWYNVQTCSLAISGTDADRFSVNPTSIASSLDNYGKESIEISYLHTISGSHSATLTIQSADNKSATVSLSGTTNKVTPTITWIENLSPMEKGSTKENPAQAGGLQFTYESSDPSVIEIINGNTLHALEEGEAEITAMFDGTHDVMWNSASATTTVKVTNIKVLRIDWPQSFSNLKIGKPDVPIQATVYYYNFEDSTTVAIDRPIIFESQNTDVVTIVEGCVRIVGKGETTITATVEGVEDEYIGTTVTRKVKVREPSEGCDMYVLEDASGSLFTEITSFTGVQKEFNLSGEPDSITFDAWSEKWYGITPNGNLEVAEFYEGSYHTIWNQTLNVNSETSYGPIKLNRKTTKIKFFKEVGSTCYHNFASAYVTLAKYLELDNTQGKTTMSVDFPEAETSTGVTYTKYVDVNFSNISDVLDVEIKHGTNFSVLSQDLSSTVENIGEDCGDKGKVTLAIQFMSNKVENYKDTIIISNKDQSATIYLSAEVARHNQQITWNPNTNLLTTDQVTFSATTTATDLHVSFAVKGTSDVASVTPDGKLTINKYGQVTIVASQAGSKDYKPAEDVEYTFTISRVTPNITTLPVAAEVVLPKTLASCTLSGGVASVSGTFAWTNTATQIERGNTGYEVTFTPDNQDYYSSTTCIVIVPVAKDPQTITWNFNETTMYCNAQITFDATASSGLSVEYTSSNSSIAYVDDSHKLCIVKGGEVTITAKQAGDETWAAAPDINKTLTINRFTPTIVENPVAESMLIGQLLSNASLSGGRAELNSQIVPGIFAWENGNSTTIDEAGVTSRTVIFTPQNINYYEPVSCEVSVEVKKYAPEITQNPTATAITYGQALNASTLSGLVAMDKVKYPNVAVEGDYTWKEPTTQLEAGNQTALVHFTPTNLAWYEEIDIEIPIVVNKAHATTATAVANMIYGQDLGDVLPINTTEDAVSGIIEGTITWGTDVDVTATPAQGEYDYAVRLAVTDPNYVAETIDGTCHVVVEDGFVFDGHGGTSEWSKDDNWKDDSKPTDTEAKVIVIADATIISSKVNVGAITIKQGVDVTIENGGVLNVGDYDCVSRKEYGNMIVKNGGQLNLSTGEVKVNDFTLEASLGGIKDAERVSARSGSITNAEQLIVNGNAYFDIALDASGACTQGWYDLTVPFPVNALTGVQRFENGELRTNLKNEVNYAIMSYHEDVRAQGKYGWSKYRGIMQPGQCYTITIDNYYNVYRFVKTTEGSLNASNSLQITATDGGEGGDENKGWNCVGNGTCHHANIAIEGISKVQIYDHATNSYSPIDLSDKSFAVGSAFFLQTPQNGSIMYSVPTTTEEILYAPQRNRSTEEYLVTLSSIDGQNVYDQLYLSASDDALDTYEIGRDLSKFGVSSTIAQMWCSAYGMQLCDVELPLEEETTRFPIEMFAPKDGEYTLSVKQTQYDERLFLFYNENLITELTSYDFPIYLNKGNNTGYELRMVAGRQITTDVENSEGQSIAPVQKVIINERLYILCGDKTFDATGKLIK